MSAELDVVTGAAPDSEEPGGRSVGNDLSRGLETLSRQLGQAVEDQVFEIR
jgi:hypothetical protein